MVSLLPFRALARRLNSFIVFSFAERTHLQFRQNGYGLLRFNIVLEIIENRLPTIPLHLD
jgi:hypothetical protein